ncbi:MAG: hypothetical protein EAZ57_11445 [Cytophagales bacterium]|nr:MAG: hypothetical protein EAZ67_12380 [Cytophagales bacterium]TAF59375.1 MAG: hypothetical protein EAZ57_11445 [Cytophagales bacterium]
MTQLKNDFQITLQSSNGILLVRIVGFLTAEKYKTCWTQVVELMERQPILKMLIDMSESQVVAPENQQWLQTHYFPRLLKLPYFERLRVARVVSKGIFGQVSLANIEKGWQERTLLTTKNKAEDFNSLEDAERWLASQEN